MRLDFLKEDSFPKSLRGYRAGTLRDDALAAVTVAVVALPQSMAYAMIAGVEPVYGLYTAIVAAIVGSLFGSSDHMVTGPTNALALMIAAAMKDHLGADDFRGMLFLLTLMAGLMQLVLGLLRAGKIVHFVSQPVIVGFTAGAGIIIGLGQIGDLLGIDLGSGYLPLYRKVWLTAAGAGAASPWAVGLALGTIAVILASRRIGRAVPGALLGLAASAAVAALFTLENAGVRLVGAMPRRLPSPGVPAFSPAHALDLFGSAFAIAVVGLVEAMAISKSIASSSGQKLRPNTEFIGQGLANVAGSFFGCFPASGSFTRSAINYDARARTRMAGVLSGVFVAVILLFLAPYARHVPKASLAGVILVVAFGMVDRRAIRKIFRAGGYDLAVMLVTLVATVLMPDLERAILTGVTVSVLAHLWNTGEIRVKLLSPSGEGFSETEVKAGGKPFPGIVPVIHLEGNLYFGASTDLDDKLRMASEAVETPVIILRLKRVNVVDLSALEVLERFVENALQRNKTVLLCGVNPALRRWIDKIGLSGRIGEKNIYMAEEKLYASSMKAYRKAMEMLQNAGGKVP